MSHEVEYNAFANEQFIRFLSNHEKQQNKAKKRAKADKKKKCGFCSHASSHNITTCPKRLEYRKIGNEYISEHDKARLRERITETMPICHPLQDRKLGIISVIEKRKLTLIKHMIIHRCFATSRLPKYAHMKMSDMLFQVSFINAMGTISDDEKENFITGSCMDILLTKMQTSQKFIYDATIYILDGSAIQREIHGSLHNHQPSLHEASFHSMPPMSMMPVAMSPAPITMSTMPLQIYPSHIPHPPPFSSQLQQPSENGDAHIRDIKHEPSSGMM